MRRLIVFVILFIVTFGLGVATGRPVHFYKYYFEKIRSVLAPKSKLQSLSIVKLNKIDIFDKLKPKFGSVVLIGNSIIDLMNNNEFLPGFETVNRGISGDTIMGVNNRLDSIVHSNAKELVVLIGINDFQQGKSIDEILKDFKILNGTLCLFLRKVVVLSVLPINYTKYKQVILSRNSSIHMPVNSDIAELNSKLLSTLTDCENVKFINISKYFLDGRGNLDGRYTIDGLHLNGDGLGVLAKILRRL